tara:strand:- start:98 stop:472 length:375 start_codon:yes stop_codon:yes gene_type:complete
MKKFVLIYAVIVSCFLLLESCGPVIFSSRLGTPPPHWFYPNRVENVRYMYFPDYDIYYDFTVRNYIYFDNGAWLSVAILPSKYNGINLRRSRQVRIKDYHGNNIKKYHNENIIKRRNSSTKRYL